MIQTVLPPSAWHFPILHQRWKSCEVPVFTYLPFLLIPPQSKPLPVKCPIQMWEQNMGNFFLVKTEGGREVGEKDQLSFPWRLLPTFLRRSRSSNRECLEFLPLAQSFISIYPFRLPPTSKEDVFFHFAKVHPSTWTIDPSSSHLFQTLARSIIHQVL